VQNNVTRKRETKGFRASQTRDERDRHAQVKTIGQMWEQKKAGATEDEVPKYEERGGRNALDNEWTSRATEKLRKVTVGEAGEGPG